MNPFYLVKISDLGFVDVCTYTIFDQDTIVAPQSKTTKPQV